MWSLIAWMTFSHCSTRLQWPCARSSASSPRHPAFVWLTGQTECRTGHLLAAHKLEKCPGCSLNWRAHLGHTPYYKPRILTTATNSLSTCSTAVHTAVQGTGVTTSPTSGSERSLSLSSSSESRKLSTSIWSKVYFPPFLLSPEIMKQFLRLSLEMKRINLV